MTEFERFYAAWLKKLDLVVVPPEMLTGALEGETVSWDRRAAYLMFLLMKKGPPQ